MKETSLFIKIIVCVFAAVLVVGLLVALTKGANDNTGSWFDEIVKFFGGDSSDSGGGGESADKDESTTETVERSEGDPACAHTYDKGVVKKASTCMEEGLIVYSCTKCSKTLEDTLEVSNEHIYGSPKKYDNSQHVLACTVCDHKLYADHEPVPSTIAATCTTNGAIVYDCVCGYQSKRPIDKLGHNVTSWNKVSGDSTNHHGVCVREGCGAKISEAHTYGAEVIVTEATCTESGLKTKTCTTCGYVHNITIPALGHSLSEDTSWDGAVAATCTTAGKARMVCQNSGCEYSLEIATELLPHDCRWESDGTTDYYSCYVCNTIVKSASHNFEGAYVSLGEDGHFRNCTQCGADDIQDHSYSKTGERAAEESGYKYVIYTCSGCGHVKEQKVQTTVDL